MGELFERLDAPCTFQEVARIGCKGRPLGRQIKWEMAWYYDDCLQFPNFLPYTSLIFFLKMKSLLCLASVRPRQRWIDRGKCCSTKCGSCAHPVERCFYYHDFCLYSLTDPGLLKAWPDNSIKEMKERGQWTGRYQSLGRTINDVVFP